MTICGFKLTHDGSIALIDGNQLVFCYEMEKLNNSPRYSPFNISMDQVREIFSLHGYDFDRVDKWVIDGWTPHEPVFIDLGKGNIPVDLAGYGSFIVKENVMQPVHFELQSENREKYNSYLHVSGHIAAAYCTSPMAKAGVDSYILIWDGGMYPQLFYYYSSTNKVENLGALFPIIGNIYGIFAQHFGPFKVNKEVVTDELNIAGKVMAYIAKGVYIKEMIPVFGSIYKEYAHRGMDFARDFAREFIKKTKHLQYRPEDILHTFHVYIEQLLVSALVAKVKKREDRTRNLCFAGGSALNIKWNSAIRNSGVFATVWIPPFPNDAGSAIGTACCEMIHETGVNCLNWDVFSGPSVINDAAVSGWSKKPVTIDALALLLFLENEPVVFLNERAELGPRALGNRSILSPATPAQMKQVLNHIKHREDYRPVAPICLEEDAKDIFEPGIRDPYMLFDHQVKPEWKERIPAVCHLDGTARLQTVNESENPVMFRLLSEYKKLSGIPLLCNTSANHNGKGFFPDVSSAMNWGKVNYVWSGGALYEKTEKIIFKSSEFSDPSIRI
ncbi:MAG: carbamoyltransferase N-terminal domain-containing protein [Niastella sp.]|uniref:carbamoyltransferase N-terminal domain-containing protein n=1 Tax=Niastella sp. TaxID=1869183 RepID=UPI003899A7D2